MLFAAVLFAALVGTGLADGPASCELNLQSTLDPQKEPLILEVSHIRQSKTEVLKIARPEVIVDGNRKKAGVLKVAANQQLLLACTGKNNVERGSGSQLAYATCSDGSLKINNRKVDKDSASCSKSFAQSTLKLTDETCGSGDNTGNKILLAFELEEHSLFPLVEVCHNVSRSATLYSSHTVYGDSLSGAVKSSQRIKFNRGPKPLFSGVSPDSAYTKKSQIKAFDYILGEGAGEEYVSDMVYLARGHLSPDADFIYNSGQLLTYYYVNAAPQWQTFNAGNWLTIENAVRDLGVKEDCMMDVKTGTYGILTLKNKKGKDMMIYLEPKKKLIPVPKVFWKIVQHPLTKSCTVVVGHNNVHLKEPPTPICDPVTPKGWPTLDDLKKGYTYYCHYSTFKKVVTYAPDLDDCKDLFEFPELQHSQ